MNELNACFECTDREMLISANNDVCSATETISDYIAFCIESVIPTKTIKLYPNNKPWITKSLKSTINEKKLAFRSGDRIKQKEVQKKLKGELRKGMLEYKEKVQKEFQKGNMRDVFKGIKILTGQDKAPQKKSDKTQEERSAFAENLNDFYCRFERPDLSGELDKVLDTLKASVQAGGEREEWM